MIRQQIDVTKTFDNAVRRITVLIRAADLLWPFEQDKARAAFTEAFEVAVQNEKEKSEQSKDSRSLLMATPDQRYVVIRAVAKRDSAWAKKLTEKMLKLDRQSGEQAPIRDSRNDVLTAQKLLDSATQLIPTDPNAAVDLARVSLNYPASFMIARFLYKLAEVNQPAADQFYDQALSVYADRPMREFLYLATYPFAFRSSGDTPVFGFYYDVVPANFVTNNSMQRRFVQTLLRRAQQALEVPLDEGDNFRNANGTLVAGTGHILQVLIRIEPQVRERLPDLIEAVVQAREQILTSLPVETQKQFVPPGYNEVSSPPTQTFDERIETAETTPNVNQREDLIVEAVLSSSDKESLDGVMRAIDKLSDSNMRETLIEWFYFNRAKDSVTGKRFDEAESLASKVKGREQRAYLHMEIARGLLNRREMQTHAREVLDEAISEANKAGMTIFAARTLLTASNLYVKIDPNRSISVLGDAINCINHIKAPDFSAGDRTLVKELKRKSNPGRFLIRFYMPGLDPENAFREMAKTDFNDVLSLTSSFDDKFLRAVTTLAVADVCLQQSQPPPKDLKKTAKP